MIGDQGPGTPKASHRSMVIRDFCLADQAFSIELYRLARCGRADTNANQFCPELELNQRHKDFQSFALPLSYLDNSPPKKSGLRSWSGGDLTAKAGLGHDKLARSATSWLGHTSGKPSPIRSDLWAVHHRGRADPKVCRPSTGGGLGLFRFEKLALDRLAGKGASS